MRRDLQSADRGHAPGRRSRQPRMVGNSGVVAGHSMGVGRDLGGGLQRRRGGVGAEPPRCATRPVRHGQREGQAAVGKRRGVEPVAQLDRSRRRCRCHLGEDLEGVHRPRRLTLGGAEVRLEAPAVAAVSVAVAVEGGERGVGLRRCAQHQLEAAPVEDAAVGGDECDRGRDVDAHFVLLLKASSPPSVLREAGTVLNEPDIYREWDPPQAWRHAVSCCCEQRVGEERVQRVLPDGHADLLLYDSGTVEVVGVHDEVSLPRLPAGTHIRGVRFRPAAVAAAFRLTASSLRNRSVPAEHVLGGRDARLLTDKGRLDAWIRSVEPDPRTMAAVRLLASLSVSDTAERISVTPRQLQRLLLTDVGLAPKAYQRVARLQRFVRAVDGGSSLAEAAADAGYSDQPHVTREVRLLSGVTPGRLAEERRAG